MTDPTPRPQAATLVEQQAEDAGLWFIAATAPEAYLQQALRALHVAVEADAAHLNHMANLSVAQARAAVWQRLVECMRHADLSPNGEQAIHVALEALIAAATAEAQQDQIDQRRQDFEAGMDARQIDGNWYFSNKGRHSKKALEQAFQAYLVSEAPHAKGLAEARGEIRLAFEAGVKRGNWKFAQEWTAEYLDAAYSAYLTSRASEETP